VRIPRFPIGAVLPGATAQLQLQLPLSHPQPHPHPLPPSHEPHWDDRLVALADTRTGTTPRLRVVSAAAGRARIRAGMSVDEARAMCTDLEILQWNEATVNDAITRATAAFVAASPQVTPAADAPGTWWIGANGFSASGGELALAHTLLALARRWSPHARVAIADSCVAARAATWQQRPPRRTRGGARPAKDIACTIIPPGECAAWLAPAPLGLVPMDDELREALVALGLRTVGAFAALAIDDVERRWGPTGLAAWRLSNGIDPRRPGLTRLDVPRTASADLGSSTTSTEPILFLVRAALDRLVDDLVADGRAAAAVAITLTLDDRRGAMPDAPAHTVTREARPAQPLARATPLFERCRALLEQWTLTAPVCAVAVSIPATAPLSGEQGDLLSSGGWHDPAAAESAFARLRAELGTDAIVRPMARDEHRPEHAGAWVPVEDAAALPMPDERTPVAQRRRRGGRTANASDAADLPDTADTTDAMHTTGVSHDALTPALRLLETPEPVDVECTDNQAPHVVRWRSRRLHITHARGPERLTGDWWKDRYARDYWRCEDADGELLLYRERGCWFVQGWYD
jgi:protein ImuB